MAIPTILKQLSSLIIFLALTSISSQAVVAQGTLIVEVNFVGNDHQVISMKVAPIETRAPSVPVELDSDLIFEFLDINEKVIHKGRIPNPTIIRSIPNQDKPTTQHENFRQEEGTYYIRYPYQSAMKILAIRPSVQSTSNELLAKPTAATPARFYLADFLTE